MHFFDRMKFARLTLERAFEMHLKRLPPNLGASQFVEERSYFFPGFFFLSRFCLIATKKTTQRCGVCKKRGHNARNCPAKQGKIKNSRVKVRPSVGSPVCSDS